MRIRLNENNIPLLATALVCLLLFTAGALRYEGFASARTVVAMLGDNAFLGVVAIGMTFVILSGGIDLSVGSVVALAGVLIGWAVQGTGYHPGAVVPAVLFGGALFGAAMGCLIHFFRLPPFLVTLAGMFLARGLAFLISVESLGLSHPWYAQASEWAVVLAGQGRTRVALPLTAVIYLGALVVAVYAAHWTPFGRNVYAIGGNEHSSLLMGLPVGRTKVGVYALSGFCAALGGVVFTLYTTSGDPRAAVGLELDAIAAVVIGGTLLTGGAGYVAGTLFGVLILGIIQTAITYEGDLLSWWTRIAIGVLLFAFIALQKLITHLSARGTKRLQMATVS
jgi:ribose/xylose/arabinose/galactoside ABC-type transport system permease subunit